MKPWHILLTSITVILLSSCNIIKPVTFSDIGNFKTVNPLSDPKIKFDAGIKNPNRFGVTIQKMEIGLSYGGPSIATISMLENTRINGNANMIVPIELSPSIKDITSLFSSGINSFLNGDKNRDFQVQGEIIVRKFIFRKRYRIKESIRM